MRFCNQGFVIRVLQSGFCNQGSAIRVLQSGFCNQGFDEMDQGFVMSVDRIWFCD
jgi:hypothetical protein